MSPEAHLRLEFSQGYAQVADLHARLCELLSQDAVSYRIDGSLVEQIDSSTLQVLAAFVRDARSLDRTVTWEAASERLVALCRVAGLLEPLGLSEL